MRPTPSFSGQGTAIDEKKGSSRKTFSMIRVRIEFMRVSPIALSIFLAMTVFAQAPIQINFNSDDTGKFPSGWAYKKEGNAKEVYSVRVEGERKFLHADARGVSVQIGYEKKWALKEFPMLQWQWRAILFPVGSNEREKRGADSALGLYVVFGRGLSVKTIKYVWSDTLPVSELFNSPFSKDTKIIVIRSGRALTGTWITEKRDVLSDYQRAFGDAEKAPIATGVAILTDSDNTNSHAIGDYADIQIVSKDGETSTLYGTTGELR